MAAVAARPKLRLSSFAISFLLSARARARARRPETQAPGGAWVSAPRLGRKGGRQSSRPFLFVGWCVFKFLKICVCALRVVGRVAQRARRASSNRSKSAQIQRGKESTKIS